MISFVALQSSYQTIELALFRNTTIIDMVEIPKADASSLLFIQLADLLKRNSTTLNELTFLAVNQGPGPFTTLRVVIAAVNGISFATNIPLIGIDALKALLLERDDSNYPCTIALLNAFNHDVYIAIQQQGIIRTSCLNIDSFLEEIHQQIPHEQIRFIGNGTHLYEKKILTQFGTRAYIPSPLPLLCSLSQIGLLGLEQWHSHQNITHQLLPLYLKQFKPSHF